MLASDIGIKVGDIVYAEYHTVLFKQIDRVLGRVSYIYDDSRAIKIILLDSADGLFFNGDPLGIEIHLFIYLTSVCEVIPITHTCNKEMIDLLGEVCSC